MVPITDQAAPYPQGTFLTNPVFSSFLCGYPGGGLAQPTLRGYLVTHPQGTLARVP